MFKISEEDKAFLRQHIKNADKLFKCDTAGPILDAIDDIIMYKGFEDNFDALNKFGLKAQYIRDTIYYDNQS